MKNNNHGDSIMEAVEALAIVSGHVEEELLIRNEYLATENQILKSKLKKPVCFNDSERIQLTKIRKLVGLPQRQWIIPSGT